MQKWGERIYSNRIRNENLRQYSIDNGVGRVNCATPENLVVKSALLRTETFIRIPGPLLMGRLEARQKHIDTGVGVRVYSICYISGQLTMILITTWLFKKVGKDWQ